MILDITQEPDNRIELITSKISRNFFLKLPVKFLMHFSMQAGNLLAFGGQLIINVLLIIFMPHSNDQFFTLHFASCTGNSATGNSQFLGNFNSGKLLVLA